MKYKVSIIVPVYNVEKYLRECLDSLVNQTLKEIEIICINDASSDNSLKILKEYNKNYPKLIKLLDLKNNAGQGNAMNHGLDAAQGEYIAFVDSDDYVDITMCEKLYNMAEENGSDYIQFSYVKILNKKFENENSNMDFFYQSELIVSKLEYALKVVNNNWSKFYHRRLWKNIRFPEFINQDLAVKLFPIIKAKKIMHIGETLYYYRVDRPGSITVTGSNASLTFRVVEFIVKESNRLNLFEKHDELIFKMVSSILCGIFFNRRSIICNNNLKAMYENYSALENHFEDMSKIYPNYKEKIIEMSNQRSRKRLRFLFSHTYVYLFILQFKYRIKNLWHKLFG